ncbi:sperm-associated antigen 11A-like [Urocitellus parryii]
MRVFFLFAVFFCLVHTNSGDIPPGIRNTICLLQHGKCRLFFCYAGEKKGDICSDPWNRCCVPNPSEEGKWKVANLEPKTQAPNNLQAPAGAPSRKPPQLRRGLQGWKRCCL